MREGLFLEGRRDYRPTLRGVAGSSKLEKSRHEGYTASRYGEREGHIKL